MVIMAGLMANIPVHSHSTISTTDSQVKPIEMLLWH